MGIEYLIQSAIDNGWIPAPERDLGSYIADLDPYVEQVFTALTERVQTLGEVGAALTAEHDLERLLEMIVEKGSQVTRADGGTLYLIDEEEQVLCFKIVQNRSLEIRMGGAAGEAISWGALPMITADGDPNHRNVSTYVAHTGEVVNISDVYDVDGFDFTGTKQFDLTTGYRSRSMLVCPLSNHEGNVIGVLQLLNAMDEESDSVIPFSPETEKLATALASQAAIAITNAMLVENLKELFDSLIQTIATAVDEKSPYTSGHITRVTELTMWIAEEINKQESGELATVRFDQNELEELRIAAWLHDIGKIVTPEYIMDKATKLQTICDRIEKVNLRYEIIKRDVEINYLRRQINDADQFTEVAGSDDLKETFRRLDDERAWINRINVGEAPLPEDFSERFEAISERTFEMNGETHHLVQPDEKENLRIARGTLNTQERKIIENHVVATRNMLGKLSFPEDLTRVPEYAGGHHEKMDGSGYPEGLRGEEIPLQSRIMALADIFEALTAEDRPYKEGKNLSEAVIILSSLVDSGKLDGRIFRVFITSDLLRKYAQKYVQLSQRDSMKYDQTGNPLDA